MSEARTRYEKRGQVGAVVFDNPKALNALTWDMWRQLGEICTEIAGDKDLRVVTFRGEGGKAFISGTDIGGFLSFETGEDGVAYEREMDQYIGTVEALPMPTLAIVDGWAVGGGVAISFACDFRIATTNAKFGSPLGRTIGNCLSMKGYTRLVSIVGVPQAKRVLMLGEMLTARELKDLGVLLDAVEPEALERAVQDVVDRLTGMAPLSLKAAKEAIRRLTYAGIPDITDLIAEVYGSRDFKHGVRSFMDKSEKSWTGE